MYKHTQTHSTSSSISSFPYTFLSRLLLLLSACARKTLEIGAGILMFHCSSDGTSGGAAAGATKGEREGDGAAAAAAAAVAEATTQKMYRRRRLLATQFGTLELKLKG